MRFAAIACDYDGTLASADGLGPETLGALERARGTGLRLILVTGRTFFELTRVCERLDLFDGIVAENGAVLYYPQAGSIRDQAPPPPPRVVTELDQRGMHYQLGRVVISVARGYEARIREVLAVTGVALRVVYNRGFIMLLPEGVSKGSGVRHVIRELGLSPHDVLALGDAENDLELFAACGFSGCPGDALPIVRERADWVFPGENGRAIAAAIVGPILSGELAPPHAGRHRVELGWALGTSEPVTIPSRGISVLVQGDSEAGKSWFVGAVIERLHEQRYAVCVIDPEGDHSVLRELPGSTWREVRDEASVDRALAQFESDASACVVMDLSVLSHAAKLQVTETILSRAHGLRLRLGLPHWIVVDEAHYSLHAKGVREAAIGLEHGGFCIVTYKASWLRPSVMKAVDTFVLARTTAAEELACLGEAMAGTGEEGERAVGILSDLPFGEFVLLASHGRAGAVTFAPRPRQTTHVRHRRKYADCRVPAAQSFLFRGPDGHVVASADSLGSFRRAGAGAPEAVLAHHAGRGDFSRWVVDVFGDRILGHQIRKLEARWTRGEVRDLRPRLLGLIGLRYGVEP